MKISLLKNLSIITFAVSIGAFIGGLWTWELPTENLASRKVLPWQPNALELVTLERPLAKITDIKDSLARPIFRKSRKPFDPSELTVFAVPTAPVTLNTVPAPAVAVAAESEQPPVVEQAASVSEPPALTAESFQLALKGIYSFDGVWKALLVSPALPNGEWLVIGTDVSGWKLTKIDENVVTISSGNQNIELKLYVDNQLNVLGTHQP